MSASWHEQWDDNCHVYSEWKDVHVCVQLLISMFDFSFSAVVFSEVPTSFTAFSKEDIHLPCEATANPPPTYATALPPSSPPTT